MGLGLATCFVLVGAGLRVWWAFEFDTEPNHDMEAYLGFAQGIAAGQGYIAFGAPTAYWPVGYPATLAFILKLSGGSLLASRLAQALFGVLALACVYRVVWVSSSSWVAGVVATAWAAFDVTQIAYTSILVSEPLFNCLMLLGAAVAVGDNHSYRRLLLSGGLFGLAAYTRAHGLLLPLLVALFGVSGRWLNLRVRARRLAWLYLGMCLVMSPWWIRNAMVFGAFVPVSNNGGINLFIGNNPLATGGYKWGREVKAPISERHKGRHRGGRGEYERGRVAAELAREFMWSHPGRVAKLARVKLRNLYHPDLISVRWNKHQASDQKAKRQALRRTWKPRIQAYHLALGFVSALGATVALGQGWALPLAVHLFAALVALNYGFHWFVAASALTMVFRLLRRIPSRPGAALPVAVVAAFTLVHVVYFANGRFLFPMRPWMAMAAGMLAANALDMLRPRRSASAAAEKANSNEPAITAGNS